MKSNREIMVALIAGNTLVKGELQAVMENDNIKITGAKAVSYKSLFQEANMLGWEVRPQVLTIGDSSMEAPANCYLSDNEVYFIPDITVPHRLVKEFSWSGSQADKHLLDMGLIHLTETNAFLHAKALLAAMKIG